jgi:proliferating cell nuclear antigen
VSVLSPIAQDSKAKKKAKKVAGDSGEGSLGGVYIEMSQHVSLTFSLKYLVNFSKSAALSDTVQLMLKNDVPLLVRVFFGSWEIRRLNRQCCIFFQVSYTFGQGYIRYYLAPKIGDD